MRGSIELTSNISASNHHCGEVFILTEMQVSDLPNLVGPASLDAIQETVARVALHGSWTLH